MDFSPGMSEKPRGTLVLSCHRCCPFQTIPRISLWEVKAEKAPRLPVSRSLEESSFRQAP